MSDVVRDRVRAGDLELEIAHPRSAEDLIDEREYAEDERLPYWADLWPSAHVLAGLLAAEDLRGVRVLELGCGVGLPSIVAALRGAEVLATDWYAPALEFVARNAADNGARVDTLLVDWRRPPAALTAAAPFDLVIGADVLYEERNGRALSALVPDLVAADGRLLIADPRRPHADALIGPLTAAGWHHRQEDHRHRARVDESGPVIRLHHLNPPAAPPRAPRSGTMPA